MATKPKPEIDEARWQKVQARGLDSGGHNNFSDGVCAMEAVAYITGNRWSDHPECVCPVIAAFMRNWNDSLPNEERSAILLPLIPLTVGTKGSKALEERRSLMAADWLVRVQTPAWLRLAKLNDQAELLASLPEITSMAQVPSIRAPLEAVQKDAAAAGAAAGAAAWAAARAAAGDAARDAAGAAARDAAGAAARDAARDAAGAAAWVAAWAAAWAAARDAARDALKPTKADLQTSAVDLVRRMCALTDAALDTTPERTL